MFEAKLLCKKYGKIYGCRDVSFTLDKNEVVGFIGPNGAGKSTTMNMMAGVLAPSSGDCYLDGVCFTKQPVEYKKHIGYLPEQPPLYKEFTVREYLGIVLKMKKSGLDLKSNTEEIMSNFGLLEVQDRLIANLSKGYKQRVGLAQAFLGNPDYVILDEPTVGLDPLQKKQTLKLIKSLCKNCGIILSSHILSEISFACDRTIIIDNGKIVGQLNDNQQENKLYLYGIIGNSEKIINILKSINGVVSVKVHEDKYLVEVTGDCLAEISYKLSENKMPIISLNEFRTDVEEAFIKATSGEWK